MTGERDITKIADESMLRVALLFREVSSSLGPESKGAKKVLNNLAKSFQTRNPTDTTIRAAKQQVNESSTVV